MSTIKVDTVRPVTADASLTLQGDNSGTGISGITIDSSGNTALGGVLKLKSSGNSITASDGTTSLISESSGTVTVDNVTLGSSVSGIGQLIGISYSNALNTSGNYVTLENNKNYHLIVSGFNSGSDSFGWTEYYTISVDSSGNVTATETVSVNAAVSPGTSNAPPLIRVVISAASNYGYFAGMVFEQGSTFDAS